MTEQELPPSGVRTSFDGAVALVELCHPPHNLIDYGILSTLAEALEKAASSPDCRAIVLASVGRSFSAGGNFSPRGAATGGFRESALRLYEQAVRVFEVESPMVAAVHGAAIGAGLGLALACDLRVAGPETFFAANFVKLGIHPGFGISATLPDLIGAGAARDMLLTGRRIGGEEAQRIGLVDRLVPQEEVRSAALRLASEVAEGAPLAVASTRATLRRGLTDRVRAALAIEVEEQSRLIATRDAAEGISAMLQKREPRFTGD